MEYIKILSFKALPEKSVNAMASVAAAGYEVTIPEGMRGDTKAAIDSFLQKKEVNILKKTKKSERIVDIRQLVYKLDCKEDTINMLISSGSSDNLKPELVLEALFEQTKDENTSHFFEIRRTDQYTMLDGSLISLDDIGCDME